MAPPVPLAAGDAVDEYGSGVSPDLSSYCTTRGYDAATVAVDGSVKNTWKSAFEARRLADGTGEFHVADYWGARYSADGSKIFAISAEGTTVGVFDAKCGRPLRRVELDTKFSGGTGVYFAETSGGLIVAFESADDRLVVEGRPTRRGKMIFDCSGAIVARKGEEYDEVRFFDVATGAAIWTASLPWAAISGDGSALFAYSHREVVVYRAGATRTIPRAAVDFQRIEVSRDGTKMVATRSARDDFAVDAFGRRFDRLGASLIDVESGATEWTVPDYLKNVRFSGDGARVFFKELAYD